MNRALAAGACIVLLTGVGVAGCAPAPDAGPDAPANGIAERAGSSVTAAEASERQRIETPDAPAAIGPYSQGVRVGNTLYLAGQIALDPATGAMVEGGIEAETRQVMENLGAVLRAAGFTFDQVVQSQVFMVDLADFEAMNGIYASYFGDLPPARATVGVASLPRGARVEILLTAVR
jgi:2-iminobutanoate/2-iminopropanoate deaminase